ncbi:TIGR02679 family protein [Natronosporangium hydrolyticum]|uniref:TIGR02679 family protein n=1 Tax=Natronosporangium hydrolyticum TaxID=2811111 RepID=A0A895YKT6_9ACTN|nr:TIGR02679 family protein [Natronosporangium hydrolyticum]QSB16595.1 TIGR02679 family protein [Natronosporangium hydrolyticum]
MTEPAPRWQTLTGEPGWSRLLAAARRSLERTGGSLAGAVSLTAPTEAERLVVIGVTGAHRSSAATRLRVPLAEVDSYLQQAYGAGLLAVLAAAAPLRDRTAEIRDQAAAREAVLTVASSSKYAGTQWYEQWLASLRRDGWLARVARTGVPFAAVVRALDALPVDGEPLPVFADRVLHDPKALADGVVRGLVLRALAAWQGTAVPGNRAQERALWESVGLVPDDLASQVLVLGLPASGGLLGRWLTEAAEARVPLRVTLHQLRLASLTLPVDEIFVCENPAVLRAAVGLAPRARPLICTEGVPSVAAHQLLSAAPAETVIRWRNDFDWPGVRITTAALARYPRALPWRMSVQDYAAAGGSGPALLGEPATTGWDPTLAAAMRAAGRAVMEERLVDLLLTDLRSS